MVPNKDPQPENVDLPEDLDIFKLQALANATPGALSLGLGDPDFATPAHIVDAARRAIDGGHTGPAPARGLPEFREAVARKLARENNIEADPESEILITTGSQEGLFLLIQALLDPGDEILVPDPRYPSYDAAIQVAEAEMVLVPTHAENGFELQADEVERRLTERSKALLLITPSNPTGAVITPQTLRRIAEIAQERDLFVISDEIYEHYLFDGAEHLSIGSLPGMQERTITISSLSKAYAMTGWRLGYLAAPEPFIDAVANLKWTLNRHTPTVSQWAGVAALDGPQDCIAEMRLEYDRRRRALVDALREMGFAVRDPRGAFYVWADISSTGLDAMSLSYLWLRDAGVMAFPGTGFGEQWSGYMRFTLRQPEHVLVQAAERIERVLRESS
ncbi:MAG: pyridoxal phosphate-dependent aminotransferase [Chloroflexota bacterium]